MMALMMMSFYGPQKGFNKEGHHRFEDKVEI